jgi:3-phenylpropionate/cinnamic acid dioxygenase small subunit
MTEQLSLEERLDAVESRQQIAEVLYRYARGWDRRDEDAVRSCFWPEASHRHGVYEGSSAEFVNFGLSRTTHIKATRHTVTNVMIELDGDRALSECHFSAIQRRPTADGRDEEEYFLDGRFVDVFQRRGGEWRILRREGLNEFERVLSRSDVALYELPEARRGRRKPEDRLYALQAEFRQGRST